MASAIHAASTSYPPLSFSQNSTDSSMNGMHLSQSGLNSFEAPQSVASTPTPTPPASRGHAQILPYNMSNYGPPNGLHPRHSAQRSFGDPMGNVPQQQYPPGHKPQIYTVWLPMLIIAFWCTLTDSIAHSRLYILESLSMKWKSTV